MLDGEFGRVVGAYLVDHERLCVFAMVHRIAEGLRSLKIAPRSSKEFQIFSKMLFTNQMTL